MSIRSEFQRIQGLIDLLIMAYILLPMAYCRSEGTSYKLNCNLGSTICFSRTNGKGVQFFRSHLYTFHPPKFSELRATPSIFKNKSLVHASDSLTIISVNGSLFLLKDQNERGKLFWRPDGRHIIDRVIEHLQLQWQARQLMENTINVAA